MVNDDFFRERFLYHQNSMKCPWHAKLSDEALLNLYEEAIEAKANEDFINLLLNEIKSRKLVYKG